jgi:hypothetical protein
MFHTKSFSKGLAKKRGIFIDICQNCWKPNSELMKICFMVYYYYNLEQLMNKTTWMTHINLKAIGLKATNNFQSLGREIGHPE